MVGLCGLILAAGASSRMGRDKALLPWPADAPDGSTLLSASISALRPFTDAIVVIAGNNSENLAPVVDASGAHMTRNPAPERGQFSSLQIGLREVLARGCDAAMITPIDCPPLSASTLEALVGAFKTARMHGQWAVAPESNGRRGHPLLAAKPLIDAFLDAPLSSNAREVKRAHAQHFGYVVVSDLHVYADMNTPEEYAAIAAAPRN